ncbi:MAG: hypothetical protein ABEJ02_03985 [Candidatus Paceibacteria bacterium]
MAIQMFFLSKELRVANLLDVRGETMEGIGILFSNMVTVFALLLISIMVINLMIPATKKVITPSKVIGWIVTTIVELMKWVATLPFRLLGWIWGAVTNTDENNDDDNSGGDIHVHGDIHYHADE